MSLPRPLSGSCHDILRDALSGSDPVLASEAARLTGEWNGRALIPVLIENARYSRFYSKVSAIFALARLSAAEAVPCLTDLVSEPNVPDDHYWYGCKSVRAAAAVALLHLGSKAGISYLRDLAEAKDNVFFRWFAPELLRMEAAAQLHGFLTVDNLCSIEKRNSYADTAYTEPGMLCMLCEALGLIPDPLADEHLAFYMDFHSRYVRGQAYRSLYFRHRDERTVQKISEQAERQNTDFDRVVSAEVRQDSAVLLQMAGQAPSGFDRGSALDALGAISSPLLQEACRVGVRDKEPYVRRCAVERLGSSGSIEEAQGLAGMLGDEKDPQVRCALAAVLLAKEARSC